MELWKGEAARWDRVRGFPGLPGDKAHFGQSMGVPRHPGSRAPTDVHRTGHTQMDPDLFLHTHTGEQWWDALCYAPCVVLSSLIGAKSRAAAADQDVQGNWNGPSIKERLLQSLSTAITTLLSPPHQGYTEVLWCLFPEPSGSTSSCWSHLFNN